MIPLTDKAKLICRQNYDKNCGGCPLRTKCVTNTGPGREALDRWTNGVNELAERLGGQLKLPIENATI